MGQRNVLSENDHNMMAVLYDIVDAAITRTDEWRQKTSRSHGADAIELQAGGPDFLGIATWIFDIYLSERLNGISANGASTITENAIRNTGEWRSKH